MPQRKSHERFETLPSFDHWAARQEGRWELHDGRPVAMAPERVDILLDPPGIALSLDAIYAGSNLAVG